MYNPLKMSDWGIRKFLGSILAIQLAVWVILGLEAIGLQIPLIRQLIPIIYLTYVPGILILRVLKVHRISAIESLLYSVGLSIATVMFIGFFVNIVYPLIGIARPFSVMPLSITISTVVLLLCFISYIRDRDFSDPHHIDIKEFFSPPVLFLLLIPILSILGTRFVNLYHNNIILMSLIVIIGGVVLLIGFNKFIPKNLYPLAIFLIGLSLLFHRSLISTCILGSDIHHEYYLANLVVINGIWDYTIPSGYNSMLSITSLAPICSIIGGISLTWLFKIVYPLLFSLVPLGLYRVFRIQTDDKIAFFSCFFFIAAFQFHNDMPTILRQQIGTLFLVVLIMLMIARELTNINKIILFIIAIAALIVSHYGVFIIYMLSLISAWLFLLFLNSPLITKLKINLLFKFDRHRQEESRTINLPFISLFVLFTVITAMIWYFSIASSVVLDSYVNILRNIVNTFTSQFLNPEASHGLTILTTAREFKLVSALNTVIDYLNQILIVTGVLVLLFSSRGLNFTRGYTAFAVTSLFLIFVGIFVPFISIPLSMERIYHVALVFLAPCGIIGALTAYRVVNRAVRALWKRREIPYKIAIQALAVYFVVFFLYQTGFVYELANGYSGSLSISQEGILKYGSNAEKGILYSVITQEQDALSADWLSLHREPGEKIFATYNDIRIHSLLSYGMIPIEDVPTLSHATQEIPEDAYVYLQSLNVIEGLGTEFNETLMHGTELSYFDMTEISRLYQGKNKIYANGGSEIYR